MHSSTTGVDTKVTNVDMDELQKTVQERQEQIDTLQEERNARIDVLLQIKKVLENFKSHE